VQQQPVTIAVNASKWHLYSNGIVDDASWCSGGVNHAVNAVGYGTDGGVDYWLIRNSWGTGWGESGYIRLKRGSGNGSGMCSVGAYGYWANVTVAEDKKEDNNSGPVAPSDNDDAPDNETCAKCEDNWWQNLDCIKCLLNMKTLKHKWFKSDMSNLTPEQEEVLAEELWKMKNDFEKSLEKENK